MSFKYCKLHQSSSIINNVYDNYILMCPIGGVNVRPQYTQVLHKVGFKTTHIGHHYPKTTCNIVRKCY